MVFLYSIYTFPVLLGRQGNMGAKKISTFDALETYKTVNKRYKKHNAYSRLKRLINWANTPAGQTYYKQKLKQI